MPAWSTVVAAAILQRHQHLGLAIAQARLQRLVYVAHGQRLACSGQPLTGDRPEAWAYGPVYRRLAEDLAPFGSDPIPHCWSKERGDLSDLDAIEHDLIEGVCQLAATLPMDVFSALTRGKGSPWECVYNEGRGLNRDISHRLIAEQATVMRMLMPELQRPYLETNGG